MAGRWRWRAAVLVTVGLVLGAQELQASAGTDRGRDGGRDTAARDAAMRGRRGGGRGGEVQAGHGVERYNPDIDGNRVVFTHVTRRRDGTSAAGVWSRDLTSGRETLVAEVGTGEPSPVASPGWTVWSEVASGEVPTTVVRARSTARGANVIDVYSTDYPPYPFYYGAMPLPSVDISGNRVATVGNVAPDGGKQLVRFDLPSTTPAFVDVMATAPAVASPGVGQSGATSVIGLGNGTLFSIVDGAGNVVASPTAAGDCSGPGSVIRPAIDGNRVAAFAYCNTSGPSILTCTLPCDVVDALPVDLRYGATQTVALSGSLVAYSAQISYNTTAVVVLDLAAGGTPVFVHQTSGTVGPRVSISGRKVVWDETIGRDRVTSTEIYLHDLDTGKTVILADGGRTVAVEPATGPIRLNSDVRSGVIAYTEVARNGGSAGIWTRSLSAGSTLVSSVATDSSTPRLGDGWIAWNTLDPGASGDRVVATTGPSGPLVDVYSTDVTGSIFGYSPEYPARALVDAAGSRVAVGGYTLVPYPYYGGEYPQPSVFSKDLPTGDLSYLAPIVPNPYGVSGAYIGRTNGRYTATIEYGYANGVIDLFDGTALVRQLAATPATSYPCSPNALDITETRLVVATACYGEPSALISCTLPCESGFTDRLVIPDEVDPLTGFGTYYSAFVVSMSASGNHVAVARYTIGRAGRAGDRNVQSTRLELYNLARPNAAPTLLAFESGNVSEPRVDGNVVTWSVDQLDGSRRGTVYVYDIRRGRTTSF